MVHASSDQFFLDLTPSQINALPKYSGKFLLALAAFFFFFVFFFFFLAQLRIARGRLIVIPSFDRCDEQHKPLREIAHGDVARRLPGKNP